jgi:hypothetical protein
MRLLRLPIALAVSVGLCATASAATRYAAPAGVGTPPCTLAAPCPLGTAITGALAGDDVVVLPGDFTLAATVSVPPNVTVHGQDGSARPLIHYTGPIDNRGIDIGGANVTLRWLAIDGVTDSSTTSLVGANPTGRTGTVLDRVEIRQTGAALGLQAGPGAVVRDSLITGTGFATMVYSGTLTGSTVVNTGSAAASLVADTAFHSSAAVTVRNSILFGSRGVGGVDARAEGAAASIDIDYSAIRSGAGGFAGTGTVTLGTHNVATAPLLGSLTGTIDAHQLAGSPTIDRGDLASAGSSLGDTDGDLRVMGPAPDIGADEFRPAPTVTTVAADGIATRGATLNGSVNPNGRATTYMFEFGTTTAYGKSTTVTASGSANLAQTVRAAVVGLAPATVYHARVVAGSDGGTSVGGDITFTTDSLPAVGKVTLTRKQIHPGQTTTLRFSLSKNALVRVNIDRLVPGRKRAGVCRTLAKTGVRCTKPVRRAAVKATVAAGANVRVTIPAKPGGKRLAPGIYRLTVLATDPGGNRGSTRIVLLTVR